MGKQEKKAEWNRLHEPIKANIVKQGKLEQTKEAKKRQLNFEKGVEELMKKKGWKK